ncbi:MAG: non-ribosomal peptide synthetase, partial [Rhodococcus sp. (in: high G+C Gram-positive bacteria)]
MSSFPLSRAQQALWFAQQIEPDVALNIAQYVELRGPIDVDALIAATDHGCRELESPAVRLIDVAGEPHQLVDMSIPDALAYRDLRGSSDPVAEAHRWMTADYSSPLDMMNDRLITATLLHLGHDHYYWYSRVHHLVMDGHGAMVLMNRVAELYTHCVNGTEAPQSHAMSLRELHDSEEAYRQSSRYVKDQDYWATRTEELPAPVRLSQRAASSGARLRVAGRMMDPEVATQIEELARLWNSSEVPVVVAAFAAYLSRLTGTTDIVLTLPVSARTTAATRRSAGMVANTVPMRVRADPAVGIRELVRRVQLELTGALRHQRFRSEDMRSAGCDPTRRDFGPRVNIMNFYRQITLDGVVGEFTVLPAGRVEDLAVNLYPSVAGQATRVDFTANPRLYSESELSALLCRFMDFLASFTVAGPEDVLGALDVLTVDERTEATAGSLGVQPDARFLHELFLDRVADCPDAVAVTLGEQSLTYAQLDERSAAVSTSLIEAGVVAGDIVAVALPQSPDL